MLDYQKSFLEFVLQLGILRFGEFTLKSGRVSPYFFNAGLFNTGAALLRLGEYYAQAIVNSGIQFDILFGPAYKGIPLAVATTTALAQRHHQDIPYCFSRKEAKRHGEGGSLVGAPLNGKVLIIDDVVSSGASVREAADIITAHHAQPVGVVVALDRMEKGQGEDSAIEEMQAKYNLQFMSIANLSNLVQYIEEDGRYAQYLPDIKAYQERYGV